MAAAATTQSINYLITARQQSPNHQITQSPDSRSLSIVFRRRESTGRHRELNRRTARGLSLDHERAARALAVHACGARAAERAALHRANAVVIATGIRRQRDLHRSARFRLPER